ncbi:MAG: SGNH/GDSL hydrolase family protein [Bacilli bacterium]|nr:SGNH/GDSL hydrolase family protein [Bacilli bacterium]
MILFLGDSLTEGSNSKFSFTDYLPPEYEIFNLGVSGTTIGEYSIYPVDGNSLLGVIGTHGDLIQSADEIFIEYGSNDVSAIMCGFATIQTVIVSFVKAIDWIKQLNPNVRIHFLAFGESDNIILSRGINMCNYLEKDYFSKFDFKFPVSMYVSTYKKLISHISKVCDIMYMFDDEMIKDEFLSDDNIHPNEIGHERIAKNILKQIRA